MEIVLTITTIIANVTTVAALIFAWVQYKRSRTIQTAQELSELIVEYKKLNNQQVEDDVYKEWVGYLSNLNRFADSVNKKILDVNFVKRKGSMLLCQQYDEKLKEIIVQRRNQFKDPKYYKSIDQLIESIRQSAIDYKQ